MSVAVELGTNAVRHTASGSGGQFVVEVTWWMQIVRVAVYDDGSPDSPRVTEDLLCEVGRGLLMVNTLSVRMGVDGNAQGRMVWADILWTGRCAEYTTLQRRHVGADDAADGVLAAQGRPRSG